MVEEMGGWCGGAGYGMTKEQNVNVKTMERKREGKHKGESDGGRERS